jgi:RNA recognition motif-containing protein
MNIYIGNIDTELDEESLAKLFEVFGKVDSIKIIRNRETNKSKGFGFVTMENSDDAERAIIELNNIELAGRRLVVQNASQKNDNNQDSLMEKEPKEQTGEDFDNRISFKTKIEEVQNPVEYTKTLTDDGFVKIKFNL